MGIIYKLNDEIVKYVLQKKRENSRISCRQLALIVEEKFQINVSKSSIGALLKEANLSSPIGRPSIKSNSSKKFSIPPEKKTFLFGQDLKVTSKENIHKKVIYSEGKIQKKTEFLEPKKSARNDNNEAIINIKVPKVTSKSIANESNITIKPEANDRILHELIEIKDDIFEKKEFEEINWNMFLARLAFWEFFNGPVFDDFFKRQTALSQREIDIVDVIICMFPEAIDNSSIVFEKQNLWLWKVNGWVELPKLDEIEQILKYLKEIKISEFDFNLELTYFLTMINAIKIIFSNGSEMMLDGRLMKIRQSNCNDIHPCPIERTMDEVTIFLSGKKVLDLYCPDYGIILKSVEQLIGLCSTEIKISKILLIGQDEESYFGLCDSASVIRKFKIATQITMDQLNKMQENPPNLLFKNLVLDGNDFNLNDMEMEISTFLNGVGADGKIRVLFYSISNTDVCKLVITNIFKNELPAKNLIEKDFVQMFELAQKNYQKGEFLELFDNFNLELPLCEMLLNMMKNIKKKFMESCFDEFTSRLNDIKHCFGNVYVKCDVSQTRVIFKIDNFENSVYLEKLKMYINLYARSSYGFKKINFLL